MADADAVRNLPACTAGWQRFGAVSLENLSQNLVGYVCGGADEGPRVEWLDETMTLVPDIRDLRILDGAAFKEQHFNIDPMLEKVLASAPSTTRLTVHVWFRVDEPQLLDTKDDLSKDAAAAVDENLRKTANALASEIKNGSTTRAAEVISRLDAPQYGPPRIIVAATPDEIREIGKLDSVQRILPDPGPGANGSAAYYGNTGASVLDSAGWDGTGRRVAIVEGGRPDSTQYLWPGLVSGSCSGTFGSTYFCHCPGGASDAHSRLTSGMISNSCVPGGADNRGGTADSAQWISANFGGGCSSYGPDVWTSAVNWAVNNGASVISTSHAFGAGSPQNVYDMMFDYYAVHYPYPFIAALKMNGGTNLRSEYNLYNGIVVGGSDDHGSTDRTLSTLYFGTQATNYNALDPSKAYWGQEVPSLVAPAVSVDSAGFNFPSTETTGGTSMATPIVAGIAASLQEENSAAVPRPELLISTLLASADQSVDGGWLDLADTIDDNDGVGLVNGSEAKAIIDPAVKKDGGNVASTTGHD